MMLTDEEADRRVARGVKRLNKAAWVPFTKIPRDWRSKLNLETLDLGSSTSCVLGQLTGTYSVGARRIAFSATRAAQLGFDVRGWPWQGENDYRTLTNAWKRALRPQDND